MDFSTLSLHDDLLCSVLLDDLFLWFKTRRVHSIPIPGTPPRGLILDIINHHVIQQGRPNDAARELLGLRYFQDYLAGKSEREQLEFAQHLKRYLYMYMPNAGYEIGATRYADGDVEACIIATKDWKAGDEIRFCTGVNASLDQEEETKLKQSNRDFSVMYSSRKDCNCLFLGPARFMNHDCDANCRFISLGLHGITFKVAKDVACGEELTVFYSLHYFGQDNCECRCATCEERCEGYFASNEQENDSLLLVDQENDDISLPRRSTRKRRTPLYEDYITLLQFNQQVQKPTVARKPRYTFHTQMSASEDTVKELLIQQVHLNRPPLNPCHEAPCTSTGRDSQNMDTVIMTSLFAECDGLLPNNGADDKIESGYTAITHNEPVNELEMFDDTSDLSSIDGDELDRVMDTIWPRCLACQEELPFKFFLHDTPRCPRCERHQKIFRFEWPLRKQKTPWKRSLSYFHSGQCRHHG